MQPMFVVKNRHTKSFLVEKLRNSNLDIQSKLINSFSRLNVSTVRKIEFNFIINTIKVKLTSKVTNRTGTLKSTVKISSSNTLAVVTIQAAAFRIIKSMIHKQSEECGEKKKNFSNQEAFFTPCENVLGKNFSILNLTFHLQLPWAESFIKIHKQLYSRQSSVASVGDIFVVTLIPQQRSLRKM